jgi:DNA-binding HxlR family transcriptional regulator
MLLSNLDLPVCENNKCVEVKDVLTRVGDKWSLYVVVNLYGETLRFNELKRRIDGISQRMLTLTLRGLERDGLLTRTVYPTNPPSVSYALTELGRTLLEPVLSLVKWAESHRGQIELSRNSFDAEGKTA